MTTWEETSSPWEETSAPDSPQQQQGLGGYLAGQGWEGMKESVTGPVGLLNSSTDNYNTQSPSMQAMPDMVRSTSAALNPS